ncbi:MAG: DUF885 domain-containing protein [Candidatus Sericytochromatia bacterium]
MKKNNEDIKLEDFLEKKWHEDLENNPEFATFLGVHTYNNKMNDHSEKAILESYQRELKVLEELEKINYQDLSENNKLNYDLFYLKTKNNIDSFKYEAHLMPINQMNGFNTYFARLIDMMPFKTEKDYENYLSRINFFNLIIEQLIDLMKKGMDKKLTVPKIAMKKVILQIKRQIPDDITQSSFYKTLKKSENISKELLNKIETSIKSEIYTGFNKLANFIEEVYLPACRDSIGISDLENGLELYNFLLKELTTTDLTAEEIHNIGLKEVERIFSEMNNIMKELGFNNYEKFLDYLRTNPDFYYNSPEMLLMSYRDFCKRVDKELPAFFKVLPRLPYGVEKVPDYQAPSATSAYYMGASMEMTRAGVFYVNTYKLETRAKYEKEVLALHEAVPGHHLQISLALEMKDLPKFRKVSKFIGYVEGWGLYCEKLGEEMGFYQDLFSKFGRLVFEMRRACRLVIDTGIHAFGWEREKAIDYLAYYTGKSKEHCEIDVDRYIVMPAQACTYKIGEIKILEIRKKFEATLGKAFDIRDFHDIILRNGSLPLNILEKYAYKELEISKH